MSFKFLTIFILANALINLTYSVQVVPTWARGGGQPQRRSTGEGWGSGQQQQQQQQLPVYSSGDLYGGSQPVKQPSYSSPSSGSQLGGYSGSENVASKPQPQPLYSNGNLGGYSDQLNLGSKPQSNYAATSSGDNEDFGVGPEVFSMGGNKGSYSTAEVLSLVGKPQAGFSSGNQGSGLGQAQGQGYSGQLNVGGQSLGGQTGGFNIPAQSYSNSASGNKGGYSSGSSSVGILDSQSQGGYSGSNQGQGANYGESSNVAVKPVGGYSNGNQGVGVGVGGGYPAENYGSKQEGGYSNQGQSGSGLNVGQVGGYSTSEQLNVGVKPQAGSGYSTGQSNYGGKQQVTFSEGTGIGGGNQGGYGQPSQSYIGNQGNQGNGWGRPRQPYIKQVRQPQVTVIEIDTIPVYGNKGGNRNQGNGWGWSSGGTFGMSNYRRGGSIEIR